MPLGLQLFVHLGTKAMHQHQTHAHALNQGQVLCQIGQLAGRNGLASQGHHKGFAPMHVNVGRHRAKPGHKGEMENVGHGQA